MEARWISGPVGGRASFWGVRAMVCWGGAQMAAAVPRFNKVSLASAPSRRRRRAVCGSGVVSMIFSGGGVLRIVKELHRRFFLLLHLQDGCGLLDPFGDSPSAINNVRPAQRGAAAAARHQHGLEIEYEGHLKIFIVIFVFLGVLYCSVFLLIPGPFRKKNSYSNLYD